MIPQLLSYTKDAFNNYLAGSNKFEDSKSKGLLKVLEKSKSEFSSLKGGMLMILSFHDMMNSSSFKSKIGKPQFIETISYMLEKCESVKG